MTKENKVDILYKMAMGQSVSLTASERKELSKYDVRTTGKPYTTKGNIRQYISDADKGYKKSFYDWCVDNGKGDRRLKGGQKEAIRNDDKQETFVWAFMGWLFWGVAFYWILGGQAPAGVCAVLGAIASVVIFKMNRASSLETCFILPLLITCVFYLYIWKM
jgi:hypothetical protein